MQSFHRRGLFGAILSAGAVTIPTARGHGTRPSLDAVRLAATTRTIEVNGRAATVFGILRDDGSHGLTLAPGERFRVALWNRLSEPTAIHWHGQLPPSSQDGVPVLSQSPLPPNSIQLYDFAARSGTHWMHAHTHLQEQRLLAAPLIVRSAEDVRADAQDVVMMLADFSFKSPEELMAELTGPMTDGTPQAGSPPHAPAGHGHAAGHTQGGHAHGGHAHGESHLNDVEFDAYLANDRTLDDPRVVRVERSGRVRLRIINAAAATNFFVDLGTLEGSVVAVDGCAVQPVAGSRFPLGIAQRLDVLLTLPGAGAWPVLAQREGDTALTGIVLATPGAAVHRISSSATTVAGAVAESDFESTLLATTPLPDRPIDREFFVAMTGSMTPYVWGMGADGAERSEAIEVRLGERVSVMLSNETDMAHPIHLHGHEFQVVAIDGLNIAGAVRDTVMVAPGQVVQVVFDAMNPGRWAFHCHLLYHMAAGMMAEIRYVG